MKSKVIYDASENAVSQELGLTEKDIENFKRKMVRLHKYLNELAEKANNSVEVCQMIKQGLMDVMDWFIPIRG